MSETFSQCCIWAAGTENGVQCVAGLLTRDVLCSKVQLHGLEEWCVGVVPAEPENQFKPGSAGRQSGSQAQ